MTRSAGAAEVEEELSDIRLRVGGSLLGGAFFGAGDKPSFGINGRLGLQFGRRYAAYAQPLFMGASNSYLGGSGAMFEMTFLDSIFVGAGPDIVFGRVRRGFAFDFIDQRQPPDHYFFGLAARTGFAFGDKSPVRRSGYTVGLDLRVVFVDSKVLYAPFIAFGFDAF
jgi:hypothetical protein